MKVSDLADSEQVYQLQKRLEDASDRLAKLVPQIGKARQVIEFSSDMRKRALAKAMSVWLDAGESASAAEAKGRASYTYEQEMIGLGKDLANAETVRAEWEATKTEWESCRSMISLEKQLASL